MTPNGTRVPKEPPPADNLQWPDWAQPLGETSAAFQGPVSPPPLPPEMRGVEGAGKPEEPSRAVTELPELPGFTPQEACWPGIGSPSSDQLLGRCLPLRMSCGLSCFVKPTGCTPDGCRQTQCPDLP